MQKYKYLLKNVGLLTISGFGTKILSFLLIPLYTSVLSTTDYGIYDIYNITVSLMIPILTMNIIESVMRFSLDSTNNTKDVFSIGLKRIFIATLLFSVIVAINDIFNFIPILSKYSFYLILMFLCNLVYELLSKFCRGLEKISDVAIAGALNSISMILFNILFLLKFKIGLNGYFLANILSLIIPTLYLIIREKIWNYFTKKSDLMLKKEMFMYSSPLVINTLSWWINNASDRLVITMFCGTAINGIYSIAYKIPSIINVFQTIFSQAWVLSAVKEFKKDNGEFYCKIYKIYNCGMLLICSALIVFDKIIAKILFAKDFYIAWKYAPILIISSFFGAISGYLGGIFSAAKKSKIYAKTTSVGAIVNIILNFLLIKDYGAYGAAIATLVSYIIVWIMRLKETNKIIKLNINIKLDVICYVLLILQAIIINIIEKKTLLYFLEVIIFMLILGLNMKNINELVAKIRRRKNNDRVETK